MKIEQKRIWYALFFPFMFILLLWLIGVLKWSFDPDWHFLGIYPRHLKGLVGIITEPLIHENFSHLFYNSIPLIILGWCLCYFYKGIAYRSFFLIWITSGVITWLTGRESWHIGASGLVYGLCFFLFFSGIFRKYIPLISISLLVAFLYGSMIWNMFPISELVDKSISWEGHLSGAIAGFVWAVIFRNSGPQKPPEPIEEEEEEEENTDLEVNLNTP